MILWSGLGQSNSKLVISLNHLPQPYIAFGSKGNHKTSFLNTITTLLMEAKALQAGLNELLETLKDGQRGYTEAMTDVEDADLKQIFKKYAAQRSEYITELEDQMHKLNLHPEEESSITGTVHRAFINLKSMVTGKDRHSILAECERGEDYAKKAYETAQKLQEVPGALKTLIERQAAGIKQGHDEMRSLRDASK